MPGFHHAVAGPFRGDGQTIELTRQADCKVADIDHFLDFTQALLHDLSRFDRNQPSKCGLMLAQQLSEYANQFAATRRRNIAPPQKCRVRGGGLGRNRCGIVRRAGLRVSSHRSASGREGRRRRTMRDRRLVPAADFQCPFLKLLPRPGDAIDSTDRSDCHENQPGSPVPDVRIRAAATCLRATDRPSRRYRLRS